MKFGDSKEIGILNCFVQISSRLMPDIFHLVNIYGVSTNWHFTGEGKQYSSLSHGAYSLVGEIKINQAITLKIVIVGITLE